MTQHYGALIAACAVVFAPVLALASTSDSVTISSVNYTSGCGDQMVSFSGSATYSEATQHLVVNVDGTEILYSDEEPTSWITSSVFVTHGPHTLTATIYDKSDRDLAVAQSVMPFEVPACVVPESSSSNGGGGDGDTGQSTHEEEEVVTAKKAVVKGATTTGETYPNLKPLNRIFRSVFSRNPSYAEWKYWTNRYLTDKPNWVKILGAMQYHKLLGHTVGA